MNILVAFFVTINHEEELEDQFPITILLKKWLLYDMLVCSNGTSEWNVIQGGKNVLASFHG
jgi:hypothetical protein